MADNKQFRDHRRTQNRVSGRGAPFGEARRSAFSFSDLSRSQRREVERRQKIIAVVDGLKGAGRTEIDAAKIADVSVVSLWRWRKQIVPQFHRCGRTSSFRRFKVSDELI